MKTKLLVTAFFLNLFIISSKAQEEVFFDNSSLTTTSIQGVALNSTIKKYFTERIGIRTAYDASYFYELKLAGRAVLSLSGGLMYYQVEKHVLDFDGFDSGYGYSSQYNSDYLLAVIGVEPRYYFSINQRRTEKRGGLNSGWFVGMPFNLSYVINNPKILQKKNGELKDIDYLTFSNRIKYSVGVQFGYRHAVSNNLFAEMAVGLNYVNYNDWYSDYRLSVCAKVAVAYTF